MLFADDVRKREFLRRRLVNSEDVRVGVIFMIDLMVFIKI